MTYSSMKPGLLLIEKKVSKGGGGSDSVHSPRAIVR